MEILCSRLNVNGRRAGGARGCRAGVWIGLGSHDIQNASAGEDRCSEKNGTHGAAPELSAFSFLSSEGGWLA
jgi:hypothetical protein